MSLTGWTQENTKNWRNSQLQLLKPALKWDRIFRERKVYLGTSFTLNWTFKEWRKNPVMVAGNYLDYFSFLFQDLFPPPPTTILLSHGFYICTYLCTPFCEETHFITWPLHSPRWHFLEGSSEILSFWFFLYYSICFAMASSDTVRLGCPLNLNIPSLPWEQKSRAKGGGHAFRVTVAKSFSSFAAEMPWTLESQP